MAPVEMSGGSSDFLFGMTVSLRELLNDKPQVNDLGM
jgi:hypothetical protein